MKKTILLGLLLLAAAPVLRAYEGTSIGLILGNPTGMNIKIWTSEMNAIDVNFGYNPIDNLLVISPGFLRHFDLLYRAPFCVGGSTALQVDNRSGSSQNYEWDLGPLVGQDIWLGEKSAVSLFWEFGVHLAVWDGRWFWRERARAGYTAAIGLHYYLSH